jgi:hypothetical protein
VKERLSWPAIQAAIVLLVAGGGAMAAWRATDADRLDGWMPNIVVGLVFLAATITVFEWVLRRDATRRLGPRLERLREGLRLHIEGFCEIVAIDYQLRGGRVALPRDMLVFLDLWLADVDRPDTDPRSPYVLPVIGLGVELEGALRKYRADDLDIMEPELVRAIDDFVEKGAVVGRVLAGFSASESDEQATDSVRRAEEAFVWAARGFGDALLAWDKRGGRLEFSDRFLASMSETAKPTATA